MSTEKTQSFNDLYVKFSEAIEEDMQRIANGFSDTIDQMILAMQCGMRRFYLICHVDEIIGEIIAAEGVVFSDGTVAMRWKTQPISTGLYASMEDVEARHGHDDKIVVKFIDPARPE